MPFSEMPKKTSSVYFQLFLFLWRISGVFGDEVQSVTEGDTVTLNPGFNETRSDDQIEWRVNNILIAEVNIVEKKPDFPTRRFRDRLKLDLQTGSLTITDTRTKDAGLYTVTRGSERTTRRFNLTVYDRLPVPLIISNSSRNPSSSSPSVSTCILLCSVANVHHVTLSWLRGNSVLSSIRVSDLRNSIPLDLECLNDSYSCVVNNPISNQTTHLNTELCQPCAEDCVWCCGVEAVIRLVLSALMGVVTVAVLVYDIKSTTVRQRESLEPSQPNPDKTDTQEQENQSESLEIL